MSNCVCFTQCASCTGITRGNTFLPQLLSTKGMGIDPIATELAKQSLPLAGRLSYFKDNWVKLTQDQWVLEAVQGYRVPFTHQPH